MSAWLDHYVPLLLINITVCLCECVFDPVNACQHVCCVNMPSSIRVCIMRAASILYSGVGVCMYVRDTQPSVVCVCAPQHAECRCKGNVKCHVELWGYRLEFGQQHGKNMLL